MSNSTISFENGIFPVCKLAEFKGVDIVEGQYLVRKIEKGTGKNSLGVIIPSLTAEQFVQALENETVFNAARNWLQEMQGEMLKSKMVEGENLYKSHLALSELVEFLNAEEVKQGRISKERIAQWFDASVAETLKRAFTEKLGNIENDKMLEILKTYKAQFMNLAKREIILPEQVKVNLNKALNLLNDSAMKEYCLMKIASMEEKKEDMFAL